MMQLSKFLCLTTASAVSLFLTIDCARPVATTKSSAVKSATKPVAAKPVGATTPATITVNRVLESDIPIRFTLAKPSTVTLVIEDAAGKRVRNLIAAARLPAGENLLSWDGYDDGEEQEDGSTVRRLVAPGRYRVRGLTSDGLKLIYEFPVNSPGNPPWFIKDRTGAWLADHTSAQSVVMVPASAGGFLGAGKDRLIFSSITAEFGDAFMALDLDGKKIIGNNDFGWAGAYAIALDNGPQASRAESDTWLYCLLPEGKTVKLNAFSRSGSTSTILQHTTTASLTWNGGLTGDSVAAWNGWVVISVPHDNELLLVDARAKRIAGRIYSLTSRLAAALGQTGHACFDTLTISVPDAAALRAKAQSAGYLLRLIDTTHVGLTLDETTTEADLANLAIIFGVNLGPAPLRSALPVQILRTSPFLKQPVFQSYHTEHELLRYIHRLAAKDLTLCDSMIALGSCTMKLNATSVMLPLSWPSVANIHPLAPADTLSGYSEIVSQLESWLSVITGFHSTSIQPNAGSQGEYAGLLAIRGYHGTQGQGHRNICLIPASAHGTNPASAVMCGMKVVPVKCDSDGNIDVADLTAQADLHAANLAALMITYPSTHGVFEETIIDICALIHARGGQVYMDGANMNAQVGLTSPGHIGADVCHLNLHKTFCIPHGGGGPGVGPVCVAEHLTPFLPGRGHTGIVSSAPWGSASILTISWMYIRMMGPDGLTLATKWAILNANYIAHRLEAYIPVLYKGRSGLVAHECILDFRPFKDSTGTSVEDVAKRLIDYGYHAPTMSWPVAGTLMIEPTESEDRRELDRFCDAFISIHGEIRAIETGESDRTDNPLHNAPHTAASLLAADWSHPYTRESAAYPGESSRNRKYWPPVGRIDNVYGDKNLICTCDPVEAYANA